MVNFDDMGDFEIYLPKDFDHQKFQKESECGIGKFWLVRTCQIEGFKRFRGVLFSKKGDWLRITLDLGMDYAYTNPALKQSLNRLEIAKEVKEALGGTKLFKDAEEISCSEN